MRTYFHLDMAKSFNMKASYFLETKEHEILFEAKVIRQSLFKPGIMEFIDRRTGESITRTVSNIASVKDSQQPMCIDVDLTAEADSSFDLDGVNCWEFLADSGYTVWRHRDKMKYSYRVLLNGAEIAQLKATFWKNLFLDEEAEEEPKGLLGGIGSTGIFRVDCGEDKLEDLFMICYCLARANV